MRDIWGFLLQTLTVSGAAALLLAVKALFRDKLSPRWQFAVWSIPAAVALLPAGAGGRYALIDWPLLTEALRSALTGSFGELTRVTAPVPLPPLHRPESVWDWLYTVYLAGVILSLLRYLISYVRLRLALKKGVPVKDDRISAAAARYGLPVCGAVEVEGLPSAFVCGVLRPVLALPAGAETDDKILLHELLHLKYRDAAWGVLICLFRCVHWCNPFLWLCADLAGNDLEALCDRRALERLEGEDRRDYGRILLGMADEKYARVPGTSSIANGGRNIRRRIEAIARFRLYPAGMALVSVCVAVVLACPLVAGTRAGALLETGNVHLRMASARTVRCTSCASALDAYAKAVITDRSDYRALCAPLSEMDALASDSRWTDLPVSWKDLVDRSQGYQIYNLTETEDGWEGLLVLTLLRPPMGETSEDADTCLWLAVQPVRAQREQGRWVAVPLGELEAVRADSADTWTLGLPAREYSAEYDDFRVLTRWQTLSRVEIYTEPDLFGQAEFSLVPMPEGTFTTVSRDVTEVDFTGPAEDLSGLQTVGLSLAPMDEGQERPQLLEPRGVGSGGSSGGESWAQEDVRDTAGGRLLETGGGTTRPDLPAPPELYAADLYLNGEKAAELTLRPAEGGVVLDG